MTDMMQAPPVPATVGELTKDDKTWGMVAHLASLAGLIGIPFANVLGPLVVWLLKKDESPFVDDQGKESLNFQITLTVGAIVLAVASFILSFVGIGIIGFIVLPLVIVVQIVFAIIGGMKANGGEFYRYPFSFRVIK